MKKAIHLENTSNIVKRVLSIADISAVEHSPNGLVYIGIENYVEPPVLNNPLDKCYPMYNTETQNFYWVIVEYQYTATENLLEIENLKHTISAIQQENSSLQEVVDTLLLESLGGV